MTTPDFGLPTGSIGPAFSQEHYFEENIELTRQLHSEVYDFVPALFKFDLYDPTLQITPLFQSRTPSTRPSPGPTSRLGSHRPLSVILFDNKPINSPFSSLDTAVVELDVGMDVARNEHPPPSSPLSTQPPPDFRIPECFVDEEDDPQKVAANVDALLDELQRLTPSSRRKPFATHITEPFGHEDDASCTGGGHPAVLASNDTPKYIGFEGPSSNALMLSLTPATLPTVGVSQRAIKDHLCAFGPSRRVRRELLRDPELLAQYTSTVSPGRQRLVNFGRLGKGGQATIFRVYRQQRYKALKVITRTFLDQDHDAFRESCLNKKLKRNGGERHGLALFEEIWTTPDSHYFLMPLYAGSMERLCRGRKQWNATDVLRWAFQLIRALHFLHNQDIIHRDIKPANILQDWDGNLHISDFGFSGYRVAKNDRNWGGTVQYMAPEVLFNRCFHNVPKWLVSLGYAADIWSLGCTILELVAGLAILPQGSITTVLRQINQPDWASSLVDTQWPFYAHDGQARLLRDLLLRMLEHSQDDRISLEECVQDPMFNDWVHAGNGLDVENATDPFLVHPRGRPKCFTPPDPKTGMFFDLPLQSEWATAPENPGPVQELDFSQCIDVPLHQPQQAPSVWTHPKLFTELDGCSRVAVANSSCPTSSPPPTPTRSNSHVSAPFHHLDSAAPSQPRRQPPASLRSLVHRLFSKRSSSARRREVV